ASSWTISADGTVHTFELKRGVRFHDGTEVTAEDVVYSLRRVFELPESQTSLARQYLCHILGAREYAAGKADHVRGLEVLGSHCVRITLEYPYAPFLAVLASEIAHIVPEHVVERVGAVEFAHHPVGSGPFRFAAWIPDQRIVLTAFRGAGAPNVHL